MQSWSCCRPDCADAHWEERLTALQTVHLPHEFGITLSMCWPDLGCWGYWFCMFFSISIISVGFFVDSFYKKNVFIRKCPDPSQISSVGWYLSLCVLCNQNLKWFLKKKKGKNPLIFERGWVFSKERLAVASENWFSGKRLYYRHFSLKNSLLPSCSTFMFWEKEGDLHVLWFALNSQKVGGETAVQRFCRALVQAARGVAGRSDAWGTPLGWLCLWTHTEQLHLWHPNTTLPVPGRLQGRKPHSLQT